MKGRNAWLVAGGVLVAIIVVVVLVVVSQSGGDGGGGGGGGEVSGAAEVVESLQGIPQDGYRLGAASAPVTITEYGDLQCPACQTAATGTVPELITKWVKPGKAAIVFRPMGFIGADSQNGARAVVAASQQDRAWQFIETVYRNQGGENAGWLNDEFMSSVAGAVGMDVAAFDEARQTFEAKDEVDAVDREASQIGVRSTPTFVVKGPKGQKVVVGAAGLDEIEQAISEVQ